MYSSLPESPQALPDIIGLAFRIMRRNATWVMRAILVPTIFTLAAGIMVQWGVQYGTAAVAETKSLSFAVGLVVVFFAALSLSYIAIWILGLRLLALLRLIFGFAVSLEEANAYMWRRKWELGGLFAASIALLLGSLMVFGLLVGIFAVAAGFLNSLAGGALVRPFIVAILAVAAVVGFVLILCLYSLVLYIACAVIACEDLPLGAMIARSFQLVISNFWRSMAFGAAFALILLVVACPLSAPIALFTFLDMAVHSFGGAAHAMGYGYKPPFYLLVITQAWEAVTGMILRPFVVFAFGLYYYDLRLRREGLDITRKLQLIEAK